ncbi:hypothetical protein GCM10023321_43560 [Pseudonocardia eucalypti]|uniref:Uncharacterized protein n=1 Tax=Pseudonocardia eucalypti TaxID=648755 RepID=A0ABP9QEP6_9PSEU|nr:hypothetical protein [Pseudonocardia eucalypti]
MTSANDVQGRLMQVLAEWIGQLGEATHARVVPAIEALAEGGPGLGWPLVDTFTGS